MPEISIIGAGAIGQAFTADLVRRGFRVAALTERVAAHVEALRNAATIRLSGHLGRAEVPLPALHTDAAMAASTRIILVATTVDAHEQVALALAPVLTGEHVVVLANGYVKGSARFAKALKAGGCNARPAVLELATTPYLACSVEPGKVHVTARKRWMELASFEDGRAAEHHAALAELIPGIVVCDNALASSLNNQNPIAHVPSYLLNAAEARHGDPVTASAQRGGAFYLDDFSTDEVLRLRAAADAERLSVMNALDLGEYAIPRPEFSQRSYGPDSRESSPPRIGRSFSRRFVTEDIPYGLVPIEELGKQAGVETPVISSLITLVSLLESNDWRASHAAAFQGCLP